MDGARSRGGWGREHGKGLGAWLAGRAHRRGAARVAKQLALTSFYRQREQLWNQPYRIRPPLFLWWRLRGLMAEERRWAEEQG